MKVDRTISVHITTFFYSSQSITLCVIFISVYYETFVILLLNLFLLTVADLLFIECFAHCSVSLYEVSVVLMCDSSSWVCCLLWYFFRSRRHRTWLLTMIHQVKKLRRIHTHTHTHTHPFNSPFSRITKVSQYQKGKTNLDFTEARDSEWHWHHLGHMQVHLAPDRLPHQHPTTQFLQAGCASCRPTNNLNALKATN